MSMTVEALADWLGGEVIGDRTLVVEKVQSLSKAGPQSITFFVGDRNHIQLKGSEAAAVLVDCKLRDALKVAGYSPAFILVENPKSAFLEVAAHFAPPRARPPIGISTDAYVNATAQVGKGTNIHPGAHVAAGVVIGENCDIHPGTVVSRGCQLGDEVVLHPNVVLYENTIIGNRVIIHAGVVIGADGFSYRPVDGRHERIPHYGNVRIEDDVEIGACSTIDRAMVDETVIGQGTKVDNLVMIGHNVRIGAHTVIAGCTGVSGSTVIGRRCMIGGAVGIAGHISIADDVVLTGTSTVGSSITRPGVYSSTITVEEARTWRRLVGRFKRSASVEKRLRRLEQAAGVSPAAESEDHD